MLHFSANENYSLVGVFNYTSCCIMIDWHFTYCPQESSNPDEQAFLEDRLSCSRQVNHELLSKIITLEVWYCCSKYVYS